MTGTVLQKNDIANMLGTRKADANKGDSGHGLLLAGSREMPGAACMAAAAALRGGIGTLKVMCPMPAKETLSRLPEAMVLPSRETGGQILKKAFLNVSFPTPQHWPSAPAWDGKRKRTGCFCAF